MPLRFARVTDSSLLDYCKCFAAANDYTFSWWQAKSGK